MGHSSSNSLPTLLIIDDDPISREVMAMMFEMHGFPVSSAESGESALVLLQSTLPEVILMDTQMPGLSGAALIRAIRNAGEIRILAISASDIPEAVLDLTDGFLLKPVEPEALVALLNSATALHPASALEPLQDHREDLIDPAVRAKLQSMMSAKALRQIYQAVAADLKPRLRTLQKAMDSGDTAEVSRIGHAIKGGCAMVGLVHAAEAASVLEVSNSSEAWFTQHEKLKSALQALECMLILDFPI